ncbi:MAG: helix-turn-helix transcriptional regulator [Flavobacterium sp.]|nr:helix-turn-helix transcriptional regulator [Flavobacterium sp.]
MVNTEDFIKRLENLLEYYALNAASFSDKIGVQRSSLSHLLSGRNKPSLDFVMKISEEFPEVDLYWILNGKGTMLKNTFAIPEQKERETITETFEKAQIKLDNKANDAPSPLPYSEIPNPEQIDKIVIFYQDGTFKNYHPKS